MNRREFISMGAVVVLRSPKDAEYVASLKKVSVATARKRLPALAPLPLTIDSIAVNGNSATLSWSGGIGPFIIEQTDLTGQWEEVGELTMARSQTVAAFGDEGFFRIHDQVPMPLTAQVQPDGVQLQWTPPTF